MSKDGHLTLWKGENNLRNSLYKSQFRELESDERFIAIQVLIYWHGSHSPAARPADGPSQGPETVVSIVMGITFLPGLKPSRGAHGIVVCMQSIAQSNKQPASSAVHHSTTSSANSYCIVLPWTHTAHFGMLVIILDPSLHFLSPSVEIDLPLQSCAR